MAAHRYWRVRAYNGTYEPNNLACATLALRETHNGTDFALGNAGISNFAFGGFPASNAFDNSASSFWTNVTGSALTTGYIGADFGATPRDIVEFSYTVRPDGFREDPKALYLEYSDDNVTWTILFDTGALPAWTAGETRTFNNLPTAIDAGQLAVIGIEQAPPSPIQIGQLAVIALLEGPAFMYTMQSVFGLPCWQPCTAYGTEAKVIILN
jgi:hypothetical protein